MAGESPKVQSTADTESAVKLSGGSPQDFAAYPQKNVVACCCRESARVTTAPNRTWLSYEGVVPPDRIELSAPPLPRESAGELIDMLEAEGVLASQDGPRPKPPQVP